MGQCASSQDSDREKRPKLKKSARKYKQSTTNEPLVNNYSKSNGVPEATNIDNSSHLTSPGNANAPNNGVCENSHPVPELDQEKVVNGKGATPITESKAVVPVVLITSAVQDGIPDGLSYTNDTAAENEKSPEVPEPVDAPEEPSEPVDTPKQPPESDDTPKQLPESVDSEKGVEEQSNDSSSPCAVVKEPNMGTEMTESSTEDSSLQASSFIINPQLDATMPSHLLRSRALMKLVCCG